jgi:hypothetical protein
MMHNPFQNYQVDPTLGAYTGIATPFSLPYTAMQAWPTNPAATLNPLASALGMSCPTTGLSQLGHTGYAPNYGGIHPQQLQPASWLTSQPQTQQFGLPNVTGSWQNPYPVSTFQNPLIAGGLQNPLVASLLQNPVFGAGLPNPLLNPIYAQQQLLSNIGSQAGQPFQTINPFQQGGQGSPFAQQGWAYGQQGSPFAQQGLPYGQQSSPFGQQGSPYGQQGSPYGQIGAQLAPQSWVGQANPFGGSHGFGQIHPLLAQQLAARAFYSQGISPWLGF